MNLVHRIVSVIGLIALCSAPDSDAARKPKSEINHEKVGSVCFPNDQCVKVVAAVGTRYEGTHTFGLNSSTEWVTGVYDSQGKVVGKVRTGGDIVVFSTEAYARRDAGQETYTLHRIDGRTKPVKTPYVSITAATRRKGWSHWAGPRMVAFGSTRIPAFSDFADVYQAQGEFGGIGADGTINLVLPDVTTVHGYGDYHVLAHADGKSFTITDDQFRPLSPRLDNLGLFTTAFDDTVNDTSMSLGHASRRSVFVVKSELPGSNRTLYTLLPRQKGTNTPPGLLGLSPILNYHGAGMACEAALGPVCRRDLLAWVAIWATTDGQAVVSIEEPQLRRIGSDRYRAVHWYPYDALFAAGVVETLEGDFRILPYKASASGDMILSSLPERHPSLDAANAAIRAIQNSRNQELWAQRLADQKLAYDRYAAWEAARAEEDRQTQQRAAAETQAQQDALALIETNDAERICAAAWNTESFYARTNLMDACARLRPPAEPVSRGFWGNLAAGLAAYNRSGAGATGGYSSTTSTSSGSTLQQGDFNRSMQSIDSALRVISDPNWNGAAASAQ